MFNDIKVPHQAWVSKCDEKSFVFLGQVLSKSPFMGPPKKKGKKIPRKKKRRLSRREEADSVAATGGALGDVGGDDSGADGAGDGDGGGGEAESYRRAHATGRETVYTLHNKTSGMFNLSRPGEDGDGGIDHNDDDVDEWVDIEEGDDWFTYDNSTAKAVDTSLHHENYARLAGITDWKRGTSEIHDEDEEDDAAGEPGRLADITFDNGEAGTIHGGGGEMSVVHAACAQVGLSESVCRSGALLAGVSWPDAPCNDDHGDHTMLCHLLVCHDLGGHCIDLVDELARYPHALWGSDSEVRQLVRIAHRIETSSPNENSLAYRVHYGDLQHWHAMAPSSDLTNGEVRDMVLKQATAWLAEMTSAPTADTRILAFGKVLHLVQSSYCQGHTQRDAEGRIAAFMTRPCWKEPRYSITPSNRALAVATSARMWDVYRRAFDTDAYDVPEAAGPGLSQILAEDVFALAGNQAHELVANECAADSIDANEAASDPNEYTLDYDGGEAAGVTGDGGTAAQEAERRKRLRRADASDFYTDICKSSGLPGCGADGAFILGARWPAYPCALAEKPLTPVSCAYKREIPGRCSGRRVCARARAFI